jgi:tetratricopeptide (TPR) repeat protein
MTWDWDWDMAAAGSAFFLIAAAAVSYITRRGTPLAPLGLAEGDEPEPESAATVLAVDPSVERGEAGEAPAHPRRPRAAGVAAKILASGLLVLLAASWLPPYLGDRAQNRAVEQAAKGDAAAAAESARSATRWNPLAVDPLITLALVEQQLGRNREALDTLHAAAELQPQNYDVHYQLGLLLERAFGRKKEAAAAFRRALELNPRHESSAYELETLVAGG